MSAFLGRIHYWLYNKILLQESLIQAAVKLAESKGDPEGAQAILQESLLQYGQPVTGELENIIEHSNIHGWLQERIVGVERRLAFDLVGLLNRNLLNREEITGIFRQNAAEAAKKSGAQAGSPQDFFNLIFDHLLEGMPCDRVNEMVDNQEDRIVWKTTECLHREYWDEAGGDIRDFYDFRTAWINSFLKETQSGYKYERTEAAVNTIRRA